MDNSDVFLTGEKVRLRAFREDDLEAVYAYVCQPELEGRRYLPWKAPNHGPISRGHIKSVLEEWGGRDKELATAITRMDEDRVIGHIGANWKWDPLNSGVAVVIDPREQRKGYGMEALELMLGYIYENLPANNVSMWISDWNEEGIAFGKKSGFQESGTMRRSGMRNGVYYGKVVMDLLRREWLELRKEGQNGT